MVTIKEPPSCTISNFGGRQGLCNVQDTKYLQKYFKCPFGTDTRAKNKYQNHWGPVSLNPPSLLNDQSETTFGLHVLKAKSLEYSFQMASKLDTFLHSSVQPLHTAHNSTVVNVLGKCGDRVVW